MTTRRLKPIKPSDGITAEMFFDRVPSMFEPEPAHGTVTATCSICKKRMRPLPLVRPNEPTTKLSVRMWAERRWLELPNGRGTYCPAHLPQFTFWYESFDFTLKPWPVPAAPTFQKPEPDLPVPKSNQGEIFCTEIA